MEVTDNFAFTAATLTKQSAAPASAVIHSGPSAAKAPDCSAVIHTERDGYEYFTHVKHGRPEGDFAPALLVNPGATVGPVISAAIARAQRVKAVAELLEVSDLGDLPEEYARVLFGSLAGMADEVLQLIHAIDHKVAHTTRPIAE